jgi:hypothetical protein
MRNFESQVRSESLKKHGYRRKSASRSVGVVTGGKDLGRIAAPELVNEANGVVLCNSLCRLWTRPMICFGDTLR